ncbi:MAG: DDE-type integrase/transposase/recombinase [Candidatus Binatia bacterium]
MGQELWQLRQDLIGQLLKGKLRALDAAQRLGCSLRTLWRYRERFLKHGPDGLRDHRHSNYHKLTLHNELRVVRIKRQGLHRSARWVRDHLKLKVHEITVWRTFVKHQLNRIILPPIKPITRFQARRANDLWQIDFMGKIRFPRIGYCHLIMIKDDRSRYLLAGSWVKKPLKIYVFACLYRAFMRYGLPKKILSDKGGQFKSADPRGISDFEDYVARLGIKIIFGKRPRTKGKIERRFEFIQRDFVLEHLHEPTLEALNDAWERWMKRFNETFHSRVLSGHTPSYYYLLSLPTAPKQGGTSGPAAS